MNIDSRQIKYNYSVRNKKIEGIVIHDTANIASGANAEMHYRYFNLANRGASADIFVDKDTVMIINDYRKYYTWHCGDNANFSKRRFSNYNSVGVELCVNDIDNINLVIENAIYITKQLMAELNISVDNVVRHYDCSGKMCPGTIPMVDSKSFVNPNWINFKNRLAQIQAITIYKKGSQGEQIKVIQQKINDYFNSLKIDVDGDFGLKTENAIKIYQQLKILEVDGIAGLETQKSLGM
jgi:N-acetylmuramoyl-L-alanine amidase CwlA